MAFENLLRPSHRNRFLLATAAGVAALAVYFSAEHFEIVPGTSALDDDAPVPSLLGDHSMAVIPVHADQPDAFAAGIAVELTSRLAQVPEIEVIAARSVLAMPGMRRLDRDRFKAFEVAWIVEIQSEPGNEDVRLSAALVRDGENAPTWALEQRRDMAEVPDFIADVTGALAKRFQFEAPVQPAWPEGVPPDVYSDYLHARLLLTAGADVKGARELLEHVLQQAPDWAPALAAHAYGLLLEFLSAADGPADSLETARRELDMAQALQPEFPETYLHRSLIAHHIDWDWREAYEASEDARERAPGDARVLAAASTAAFTLGRFEGGAEILLRAIALDPLEYSNRLRYGLMMEFQGDYQAAIDAYRELMVINPDYPGVHAYLGRTLVIVGRTEAGYRHMQLEGSLFWRRYGTVLALYALDRGQEADAELETFVRDHGFEAAVQIAEIQAFAGRKDRAFEWLDRAVEQRDAGIASLVGNPLLEGLQDDARWAELMDRLNLNLDIPETQP